MSKTTFKKWMSLLLVVLMVVSCMTNIVVYAETDENGLGTEIEVNGPPEEIQETTNSLENDLIIEDEIIDTEIIDSEQNEETIENVTNIVENEDDVTLNEFITYLPFETEITMEVIWDEEALYPNEYDIMPLADSGFYNRVDDLAIKRSGPYTNGTFQWSSIPGYQHSSAADYALEDAYGKTYPAWCIDAGVSSGSGKTAKYIGTYRGIGAKALWVLANNQAGEVKVIIDIDRMSYQPKYGAEVIQPAFEVEGTIASNDVYMAMRWIAWTNNIDDQGYGHYSFASQSEKYNDANVYKDMVNLALNSNLLPTFYLVSDIYDYTYTNVTSGEQGQPRETYYGEFPARETYYKVSTSQEYGWGPGGTTGPFSDARGDQWTVSLYRTRTSDVIDPLNYTGQLSVDNNSLQNYKNMLDKLVRNMYNLMYTVVNTRCPQEVTAYVWYSTDDQRFATFVHIPQQVKIDLQKNSSNNAVSSNNKMYSFAGIKYEVYVDGQYITTLTLGANGRSNTYEFPDAQTALRKNIEFREVNDSTRKSSGYAQGPNGYVIGDPTIVNENHISYYVNTGTVSDMPITDPFNLKLYKYDSETGRSNDKLGI